MVQARPFDDRHVGVGDGRVSNSRKVLARQDLTIQRSGQRQDRSAKMRQRRARIMADEPAEPRIEHLSAYGVAHRRREIGTGKAP
ncbi:hypothetical protein D3C80_1396170 [compost metagenome]